MPTGKDLVGDQPQPHDSTGAVGRTSLLRLVNQIEECYNPRLRRALADRLLHRMGSGVTLELPSDEALRHSSEQALRQADAATPEFFLALYAVRDWVRSTHP
jgi:hypothetical protein